MTAETIATVPQTIDQALTTRAQGVYDTTITLQAAEHAEVREALAELAAALEFYQSIAAGWVPPEVAYEQLFEARGGPEWRLALALRLAAEDAMAEADEVVKVLAELGAKGDS